MKLESNELKVYYEGKSNPVLEAKTEAVLREFGYKWDGTSCRRFVSEGIVTQTWGLTFKKPATPEQQTGG